MCSLLKGFFSSGLSYRSNNATEPQSAARRESVHLREFVSGERRLDDLFGCCAHECTSVFELATCAGESSSYGPARRGTWGRWSVPIAVLFFAPGVGRSWRVEVPPRTVIGHP